MRILLVQPGPFEHGRLGLENVLWMSEPVALTSLAAMLGDEHEVRVLDLRLEEPDALPRMLAEFRPELVGATAMTTDAYQARAVAYCAKSILGKGVFTIIGGHHPTLAPEDHEEPALNAVCIGEGEETFEELVAHLSAGGDHESLDHIDGLYFRQGNGYVRTKQRTQARELDTFPPPARHLLDGYRKDYFFGPALGMASMQTSRGCAYDCNFCAIWEFYERKVRFLSAQAICDRLETMEEKFVFFLDDNFFSHRGRMEELLDEIEKRGIKKFWMTQGRTDFIAKHPDLVKRMRDSGLMMVLSGYETNDDGTLESLKKDNNRENNVAAARILNDLGILSTGIFMARPDFTTKEFDELYDAINEMKVAIPLVVLHTPLPGTQLYRQEKDSLLTEDTRFFDLLHAVTPTRLPRDEFYRHYARWNEATVPSVNGALTFSFLFKRPRLIATLLPYLNIFRRRREHLRNIIEDPKTYLRDEIGVIPHGTSSRIQELVA